MIAFDETTTVAETSGWPVLDEAHAALRSAVAGVPDDDWHAPTPCALWNVTQVLQHAAGDQVGYAGFLTGGPFPDEDPFAPSGRLTSPASILLERSLKASRRAFADVASDAEQVPTPLPQGELPAAIAVGACALDAAVHAWDIAVATGQASPLSPGLAAALQPAAEAIVEPLRAYGAYAAALPPAAGDGALELLLRYLGRDPGWQAQ
jgi:uncharacterized protein (TIGR03086 family)